MSERIIECDANAMYLICATVKPGQSEQRREATPYESAVLQGILPLSKLSLGSQQYSQVRPPTVVLKLLYRMRSVGYFPVSHFIV